MKPVKKQNDLRLVVMLVSGLLPQKMIYFSSVIEEGVGVTLRSLYTEIEIPSNGWVARTVDLGEAKTNEHVLYGSIFSWSTSGNVANSENYHMFYTNDGHVCANIKVYNATGASVTWAIYVDLIST